jgi:hypothetical protein
LNSHKYYVYLRFKGTKKITISKSFTHTSIKKVPSWHMKRGYFVTYAED